MAGPGQEHADRCPPAIDTTLGASVALEYSKAAYKDKSGQKTTNHKVYLENLLKFLDATREEFTNGMITWDPLGDWNYENLPSATLTLGVVCSHTIFDMQR